MEQEWPNNPFKFIHDNLLETKLLLNRKGPPTPKTASISDNIFAKFQEGLEEFINLDWPTDENMRFRKTNAKINENIYKRKALKIIKN